MIEDADGLTIIDTSLAFAPKRILKQLAGLGYAPVDVKRILITHAHPDHVGGLNELQKATGAEVYASSLERGVISGWATGCGLGHPKRKLQDIVEFLPLPKATFPSTPVARVLHDGDVLGRSNGWAAGGLHARARPRPRGILAAGAQDPLLRRRDDGYAGPADFALPNGDGRLGREYPVAKEAGRTGPAGTMPGARHTDSARYKRTHIRLKDWH